MFMMALEMHAWKGEEYEMNRGRSSFKILWHDRDN
jgi:hypothetical protein